MENVLVREEIILCGVEAECELLDFIGNCEEMGYEMFIEEKENEESFETISDIFGLWNWLGVDTSNIEICELDFISTSYIESDNEVNVKLKVDEEIKEFVIGVF